MSYHQRESSRGDDDPPYSRLFILCSRGTSEDDFREAFGKYGTVQDVWILKDKQRNEDKGIAYVKMEKASQAAHAMEELNGRGMENHPKPLKVMIANDRRSGSGKDPKEDEKMLRLFLVVPKDYTDEELREKFEVFGDIEYVQIVKDRESRRSKGFGYVKFFRPYHAAYALENCNPDFKPKFAEPKTSRHERDRERERERAPVDYDYGYSGNSRNDRYNDSQSYDSRYGVGFTSGPSHRGGGGRDGGGRDGGGGGGLMDPGPMAMIMDSTPPGGNTRLQILTQSNVGQDQLTQLCDLVPGLEYCDLNHNGVAYVKYSNAQCAAYAKNKLNGFEYPPGMRLMVKFLDPHGGSGSNPGGSSGYGSMDRYASDAHMSDGAPVHPDKIQQLADTLKQATEVLKQAGLAGAADFTSHMDTASSLLEHADNGRGGGGGYDRVRYSNVGLPTVQPYAPADAQCAMRVFVVCQPQAIPLHIMRDAFCRFGNMIDAFLMPGRNFGYVKYAAQESAEKAMEVLHGQELCGQRMKVVEAEPPKERDNGESARKRPRT